MLLLEQIDIEQRQRNLRTLSQCELPLTFQRFIEGTTIRESGQTERQQGSLENSYSSKVAFI
jgi:hypothetical protein